MAMVHELLKKLRPRQACTLEVNFAEFMHTIRGGWAGCPLALAKHNESEGRKTRIRRSKEERKAMVEVFIKKYQEANNGSFPSLNLAHKEVGGSFYTVREIVRDIIQENRVLGPGKLLLEELSSNHLIEENPLHSIAIEPQSPLTLPSEEVDFPVDYHQCINEESILVSDEQYTSTDIQDINGTVINGSRLDVSDRDSPVNYHQCINEEPILVSDEQFISTNIQELESQNGTVINGSRVDVNDEDSPVNYHQCINEEPILVSDEQFTSTNVQELESQNGTVVNGTVNDEDSDEFIKTELLVNECKKVKESGMPINHITPFTADVVVEKFPLDSFSWAINGSDVRSETLISTNASEKQVSQAIELDSDVGLFNIDGNNSTRTSGCVADKSENFSCILSETKSDLVEVAQIVETSNGSTLKEGSMHEVEGPGLEIRTDAPISFTFEQGQESNERKTPKASPNDIENLNKAFSNGIDQASKIKEKTDIENKADAEQTGGSQKESIPTLDRINLESWEGMPKKSSNPENNPLFKILKSFVAAFVKFWSE